VQIPYALVYLRWARFWPARAGLNGGISSGDAMHLACAAEARVDLFLTHDKTLAKKIVPGIQFIATLDTNIL
jgi:hypothetical protein